MSESPEPIDFTKRAPPSRWLRDAPLVSVEECLMRVVVFGERPKNRPDIKSLPTQDDVEATMYTLTYNLDDTKERINNLPEFKECGFKASNLTDDEIMVLMVQTMEDPYQWYRLVVAWMIGERRDDTMREHIGPYVRLHLEALRKLPHKVREASRVMRVGNVEALKKMYDDPGTYAKPDSPVNFWAIASFTTKADVLETFAKKNDPCIVYSCPDLLCANLAAFSDFGAAEAEVMPMYPAMFRVIMAVKVPFAPVLNVIIRWAPAEQAMYIAGLDKVLQLGGSASSAAAAKKKAEEEAAAAAAKKKAQEELPALRLKVPDHKPAEHDRLVASRLHQHLTEVDLSDMSFPVPDCCADINNVVLEQCCKTLESFEAHARVPIDPALLQRCTSLRQLRITDITDRHMQALSPCTSITQLDLSNCGKITDAGMKSLPPCRPPYRGRGVLNTGMQELPVRRRECDGNQVTTEFGPGGPHGQRPCTVEARVASSIPTRRHYHGVTLRTCGAVRRIGTPSVIQALAEQNGECITHMIPWSPPSTREVPWLLPPSRGFELRAKP